MILTPDHLIKQYFPEPVETTRDLYDKLKLVEYGYAYSAWLQDLLNYCLSKYVDDSDYKLLPDDGEKNYWISQKAFRTIIETSPSKIGDQIRACVANISHRVATDPTFRRQLQDQLDQESGIDVVTPKVSKKLKTKYNTTGYDAFEFSIQNNRLGMDIISGYNFQPGQKIKNVAFAFRYEVDNGVPFHIINMTLSLNNDATLSFRSIWSCHKDKQQYLTLLMNKMIRINLYADNRKLIDSYDYIAGQTDLKNLETELEKAVYLLAELNPNDMDFDQLGTKILNRYNQNEQAYALAIKEVMPNLMKEIAEANDEVVHSAFLDAVKQYWDYKVLTTQNKGHLAEDLDNMVKARIPAVTLALVASEMLNYDDLCSHYFKRKYSNRQKRALSTDASITLMYTLQEANEIDPNIASHERIDIVSAFITDQLDSMKSYLMETDKWPAK